MDNHTYKCVICGRELGDDEDVGIFFSVEGAQTDDGRTVLAAVIVGACCEKECMERAESADLDTLEKIFTEEHSGDA